MILTRAIGLALIALVLAAAAASAEVVSIGAYSQRESTSRARIGGSVHVGYSRPAQPGSSGTSTPSTSSYSSYEPPGDAPLVTTLSSDSPILRDPTPEGDGSFWIDGGNGLRCTYAPTSDGICYNVAAPGEAGGGAPPIDPRVLAEIAARRLPLLAGQIEVSPSREAAGLTGAPSWFWLEPAPGTEPVTIAQGGERVTVTAVPARIVWDFGDGMESDAGPGRPYGRGDAAREGAVRHSYRTRCLPGDQGRDPYVLPSCTSDGYEVEASVEWTVSFVAVGPIATEGTLPPRTTSTTIAYPVDEVRGFLKGTGT